jgi:hypothetical protein
MGKKEYCDCSGCSSYTSRNISHQLDMFLILLILLKQTNKLLVNIERDLEVAEDKLTEIATRLSAAEATWDMAENLYRQLADQVREHAYDIKDLNR